MNSQKSKEIKVGIVSLVSLIILVAGITIGGGINVPTNIPMLKIRFPNSGGILIGEPVVVNGVKRGVVRSVENNNGTVLVKVTLDSYKDIKSDAYARITILEITGGKKVELFPGVSGDKWSLSNEMRGDTPPDLAGLVTILGDVSGDAIVLIRRLDTITSAATKLLDDRFVSDIKQTLENTNHLTANLDKVLNENYSNIDKSLKNLAVLTTDLKNAVQKHEPTVGRILQDIEATLADTKNMMRKADSAISNANSLVTNVNGIATDFRHGDGFASKLLFDKEMSKKLDSTFNALSILINSIQVNGVNVNVRLGTRP